MLISQANKVFMADQRFQAHERLKKTREFQAVYKTKQRVFTPVLTLCYKENGLSYCRLGLSVSRKYGNAVARNQFKRRMRELFRMQKHEIFPCIDLVVIPGKEAGSADFKTLKSHFYQLLGLELEKPLK